MRELRTLEYVGIGLTFAFGLWIIPQDYYKDGIGGAFGAFLALILIGYVFTWCLCKGWDFFAGLFKPKSSGISLHQNKQPSTPLPKEKEGIKPITVKLALAGFLLFFVPILTVQWWIGISPWSGLLFMALIVLGLGLLIGAVGTSIT
jgi:hypothetical protein